jgi:replicative DNA helicase
MKSLEFASFVDKLPPACIEAEESILGGILFDPNAFSIVYQIIDWEAFYILSHQTIYKAAIALYKEKRDINLITVIDWLQSRDKLLEVGGRNKLADLVHKCVSTVNIDGLAELVNEKYLRRKLIEIGG